MDAERYRRLQEIVEAASGKPGEERSTNLDHACGNDHDLRAEAEELLGLDSGVETFLEEGPVPPEHLVFAQSLPGPIGPYRPLEILGSGGMGVVYLAQQTEPVRRQVALKLIKRGMDSGEVIARFEAERQALAIMEHPGISRVLDAGAAPDGRPYFVMELVRGMPITAYCRANGLDTGRKLELVARVCDALQHAHQKGIIHRDLKPSNVLVEDRDGKAAPKIIDFGVAKATDQRLTDRTLYTESGQMIGTPEYMSPEQARGRVLDVDTRSDIYSMGVLLYELLTGSLPFEFSKLRSRGYAEIQRMLVEEEPPRPSARVSTAATVATRERPRRPSPSRFLARELKGELDWIVMKAMDKERSRRYASASELAADIRAYLDDRPVMASAPSTGYRLRKLLRRHRKAVLGAAATLLILVAGIITTSWQAVRATRAEREARTQADLVGEVNEFLVTMLGEANPVNNPGGREMTVVEALEEAARLIDVGHSSPALEAEVRRVVASTLRAVGRYSEAEAQARAGLEVIRDSSGTTEQDVARFELELGHVLAYTGELDQASQLFASSAAVFHSGGPDWRVAEAEALLGQGRAVRGLGDDQAARRLYERGLELIKGIDHPAARKLEASGLLTLSMLDQETMDLDSAEERIQKALAIYRAVFGDVHPEVASSLDSLATVLSKKGQLAAADALFQESLEMTRRIYGDHHIRLGVALANYGFHLVERDPAQAESTLEEAVDVLQETGNQAALIGALDRLGSLYLGQERYTEAEPVFERALELRRSSSPDNHTSMATGLNNLAALYRSMGRHDDAVPMFREALERIRRVVSGDHQVVARMQHNLGKTLLDAARPREALSQLQPAFEMAIRTFPAGHVELAVVSASYGACLVRLSRYAEAEPLLLEAFQAIHRQLGSTHHRSREVADVLCELYGAWDKPAEADQWRRAAGG